MFLFFFILTAQLGFFAYQSIRRCFEDRANHERAIHTWRYVDEFDQSEPFRFLKLVMNGDEADYGSYVVIPDVVYAGAGQEENDNLMCLDEATWEDLKAGRRYPHSVHVAVRRAVGMGLDFFERLHEDESRRNVDYDRIVQKFYYVLADLIELAEAIGFDRDKIDEVKELHRSWQHDD